MGKLGRMSLLEQSQGYLTSAQVAQALGLSKGQFLRRVKVGVLPQPTKRRPDGMWLFTQEWLEMVKRGHNEH